MTRRVALASLSVAVAFSCAAVAIAEASTSTTRIDDAACHPEKGGGNIGIRSCAGLGGWAVHTARNGDKSGVVFGVDGGLQPFQSLAGPGWAPKVLWRFDGREPIAAAHRIHTANGTVTIVTRRNPQFILPMSGRRRKFIINGIHISAVKSRSAEWSRERPASFLKCWGQPAS